MRSIRREMRAPESLAHLAARIVGVGAPHAAQCAVLIDALWDATCRVAESIFASRCKVGYGQSITSLVIVSASEGREEASAAGNAGHSVSRKFDSQRPAQSASIACCAPCRDSGKRLQRSMMSPFRLPRRFITSFFSSEGTLNLSSALTVSSARALKSAPFNCMPV